MKFSVPVLLALAVTSAERSTNEFRFPETLMSR
jgi:hypothetical protein